MKRITFLSSISRRKVTLQLDIYGQQVLQTEAESSQQRNDYEKFIQVHL